MKDFLFYKRIRKSKRGNVVALTDKFITDLSVPVMASNQEVTADEECRPDKISYKWYGNSRYDWIILKFNNISNPFSVQPGMKYNVPVLEDFFQKLGFLSEVEPVVADSQRTRISKQFNVDEAKLMYNKKKSPTDRKVRSTGVTVQNGKIVFGDNDKIAYDAELRAVCQESCDSENPEDCVTCDCRPKPSDVLAYKILNRTPR